jgi:hypothetical protein
LNSLSIIVILNGVLNIVDMVVDVQVRFGHVVDVSPV